MGYTDSRGSESHNKKLSAARAKSVKLALEKYGVGKLQIDFLVGKGSEDLVNKCEGKECDDFAHQQNRRVVFIVINN